ncbi:tRNA (guanine(10)-N(2))-dimethyltransferase [Candidatus Woesearchaeota archaeon]|nr:tRNA (guanine(10)-N(2))-dimethyltransferase [Candidatus Woesearchaeota archaeon]
MILEGTTQIELPKQTDVITKKQVVFYNPAMRLNRDISVLIVKALEPRSCALPMAATGIRGIRFLKETACERVVLNDLSTDAISLITNNCNLNSVKCEIENKDANEFLLSHTGFDYIDIDPFGSPNQFLQSSILRLSRDGILAVTATDTAPLCGTYFKTCLRKYWARPIRNELMHEVGLRILIRKVQLIGTQFDKALVPILAYYKDHYFRIFFRCEKGKKKCDDVLKNHKELYFDSKTGKSSYSQKEFEYDSVVGPFWNGDLFDKDVVNSVIKLIDKNISKETVELLNRINEESEVSNLLLIDLHALAKRNSFAIPKTNELIKKIQEKGFIATRTHFDNQSIKTNMDFETLFKILGKK